MKNVFVAVALAAVGLGCCGEYSMSNGAGRIECLTTDHLLSPANVGPAPKFGWQMSSFRRGAAQAAYRIEVFEKGGARVWDSGEVASGESAAVPYAGAPLKSARPYTWTVSVKDDRGKWLPPAVGVFETGLFGEADWAGAKWISSVDAPVRPADAKGKMEAEDGTACFVKTVKNAKAVREAYWTVAGLGAFEAYVNGRPVERKIIDFAGERIVRDFLKPGFTHNGKTKYSFAYDVTHMMKTGAGAANVFAAQVSAGWWRDKIVNFFGRKSAFRAQLVLRFDDGTEQRVGTDESWLSATAGPVLRAAIFDGEDFDARVKTPWLSGGPCDGFRPSEVNNEFNGELLPMRGSTIRLRGDLAMSPAEAYAWKDTTGAGADAFGTVVKTHVFKRGETLKIAKGETLVVDFAQNAAAVPAFEFSANAGTCLTVEPAEMLNDANGEKKRGNDGPEGAVYRQNLRRARAKINYVFAGEGVERYRPTFTFFGYRYLSIAATDDVVIRDLKSIPVTSIPESIECGMLETGREDVNRLIANVKWGQYSNYLSVPTDCPQRNERLGWTADTQVFTDAAFCNADVYGFLRKWMRDVVDTQHDDGSYTGVAPMAQYGSEAGHRLGWADAGVIVPYIMWQRTGDLSVPSECWDSMMRYLRLIDETKFASETAQKYQWADWLSYENLESCSQRAFEKGPDGQRRPKADAQTYWRYLGACYWLWDARMMESMALALGKDADAAWCRASAVRALAHLRKEFVAPDGMLLPVFRDMQTPALFALKLGILEGDAVGKTRDALLENFRAHGDCLQTGFLGTSILMDTLTYVVGSPEMAYTLLLQHKNPSWLYSVDQGATTIWERWNSYTKASGFGPVGMNSFNHYAYGAVLSWMYGTMAGIRVDSARPGFRHFIFAPIPDRRVGRVMARYRSAYGMVESAWKYGADGKWTWRFRIPANTTATVTVPGQKPEEYTSGTYEVAISL